MTNAFHVLGKFALEISQQDRTDALGTAAMGDMKNMLLAGAGVGAGVAGARGLWNMVQRHINPPKPRYPAAVVTPVPIPVERDQKQANFASDLLGGKMVGPITTRTSLPGYYPTALLATGAGVGAGYGGVNALLKANKRRSDDSDVDAAKADFERALVGSYDRPRQFPSMPKTAADELSDLLDTVFDANVKQATLGDWTGGGMGLYGAYALGTGIPAAYWAYNKAERTSNHTVLDKAMKLRDRRSFMSRPSELYAVPKPVPVDSAPAAEEPEF